LQLLPWLHDLPARAGKKVAAQRNMKRKKDLTMLNRNKIILSAALMAIASSVMAAEGDDKANAPAAKKEKCFGIVKAGKNDCAAPDGTHSCAGLAKNDGDGKEWVLLPAGTCDRILGGLNAPKS
jgi:uncharacterized membrane protein